MKLDGMHVMVDLETLGTAPGSVIISLGAAQFNEGGVISTFYRRIDAQSCVRAGLTMDASTVEWWMNQSADARHVFTQKGDALHDALHDFCGWFPKGACLWGNGATFDNVLLDSAYRAIKLDKPWPYWGDRCYRTVKALYKHIEADPFEGVKHNALDDAVHQARHVVKIANDA